MNPRKSDKTQDKNQHKQQPKELKRSPQIFNSTKHSTQDKAQQRPTGMKRNNADLHTMQPASKHRPK